MGEDTAEMLGIAKPTPGPALVRLAEVRAMARRVWGSEESAQAFLFRPHPMLEGRRPADVVIGGEAGRLRVEDILGPLQYGSAA
jgi:putative toxin-antitoxin system antitoxin component (TIGR02293 family)